MRTLIVLLLLAAPASADMWDTWRAKRVADPSGRYYVVLRYAQRARAARFTYAEIGPHAVPADSEEYEEYENWKEWSAGGGLREGDSVIRRGGLENPPYEVIVSATGLGFVGIEEWWYFGHGNAVTIVPADGRPVITKSLRDLLTPREIDRFPRSTSSTWWFRGAWLDDLARKVVMVARDGKIRTIAWDDGAVAEGTDADLVRALALPYPRAKRLALELIAERRVEAAKDSAAILLDDPTEPLAVRLRAAVALAVLGDLSGKDLVVESAAPARPDVEEADGDYAIAHLPDVLGMKAIPLLADYMRKDAAAAKWGFFRLGHRAVPALVSLVEEEQTDAVEALEWLGARQAIPALLRGIGAEDEWFARRACEVAGELGGDDLAPEMTEALRRGTKVPHVVARYFWEVRHPDVVPLLVKALEGSPKDYGAIPRALRFQTGQDFGHDAKVWREWLEK